MHLSAPGLTLKRLAWRVQTPKCGQLAPEDRRASAVPAIRLRHGRAPSFPACPIRALARRPQRAGHSVPRRSTARCSAAADTVAWTDLNSRRDDAEQGRQLVAEEEQRHHAHDYGEDEDQSVLDEALAGLGRVGPGKTARPRVRRSRNRRSRNHRVASTRTTSRPSSMSSAATPMVSDRCCTSRHVATGSVNA